MASSCGQDLLAAAAALQGQRLHQPSPCLAAAWVFPHTLPSQPGRGVADAVNAVVAISSLRVRGVRFSASR